MVFLSTHARLVAEFAEQLELGDVAVASFRQSYEQWDGKGVPLGLRGTDIALPAGWSSWPPRSRSSPGGTESEAAQNAIRRSNGEFDPAIVADLFCEHAEQVLDGLDEASEWAAILDAEPALARWVEGDKLDAALEAMADLADLKSPQFAGHSRGVANLAAAAARGSGAAGPRGADRTPRRPDPRPRPAGHLQRHLGQGRPADGRRAGACAPAPVPDRRMLAGIAALDRQPREWPAAITNGSTVPAIPAG